MSIVEKTPWICKEEWEYCRNQLFGDDMLMKKKAIQHLYIWKIRCSNLPAAVESTMILAEVYVRESEWREDNSEAITATMSFESWYSMAIMRFLNLIMDSNVKTSPANTMNKLAKQFDIPEWIVEIRHIAAHGHSLPSLSLLRGAAEFCLTWLFNNYWCKNNYEDVLTRDVASNHQPFSIKCANVCCMLRQYMLKGCTKFGDLDNSDIDIIKDVFPKVIENKREEEIDNLTLEDVYNMSLLNLSRYLQKNIQRTESLVDYLLTEEQGFFYSNGENTKDRIDIRRRIAEEWKDVLSAICNSSGCWYLLKKLTNIVMSVFEESWRREYATLYVNEVLKAALFPKHLKHGSHKKLKRKMNSDVGNSERAVFNTTATLSDQQLADFLECLAQDSNEYANAIIKTITSTLQNSPRPMKFEQILELVNIYRGKSEITTKGNDCIYRLSDVSNDTHEMQSEERKIVESRANVALESDKSSWSTTPLGRLPWQNNFKPWLSIYLIDD